MLPFLIRIGLKNSINFLDFHGKNHAADKNFPEISQDSNNS